MKFTVENITSALTVNELVNLFNDYCDDNNYDVDRIYAFDESTINELFSDPWEALRSAHFGDINFTDDYFQFNGYGNIETLADWQIENDLDWSAVAEWLSENKEIAEQYGIEGEDEEDE